MQLKGGEDVSYTETKIKGRGLALSIIVISLCLISLVGVTFALFTSDINDGKIGINVTTGKVDVDIQDEEGNSLVGDVLDFVSPTPDEDIFWEPGATFYTEGFKIVNESDIAINYHLFVNSGTSGDKQLVEALEFYITQDLSTIGTDAKKLDSFKGELEEGEDPEGLYYLVVHMKEEADNKYQGLTLYGVGVTVYAVQGNVEIK